MPRKPRTVVAITFDPGDPIYHEASAALDRRMSGPQVAEEFIRSTGRRLRGNERISVRGKRPGAQDRVIWDDGCGGTFDLRHTPGPGGKRFLPPGAPGRPRLK